MAILAWLSFGSILWLTSLLGCLILGEKNYITNRWGWYVVAGIASAALIFYVLGRCGLAYQWSALLVWGGGVGWARWRKLKWQRDSAGLKIWWFAILAGLVLASLVWGQRIPEWSGELILQRFAGHDELWHLALMRALEHGVPPANPVAGGEVLRGYHYFNDLYWVAVQRATGLSLELLSLIVAPIGLAILFVAAVGRFLSEMIRKPSVAWGGLILLVFGSSLAYLAPRFFPQAGGEVGVTDSLFWLDQTITYALNQQLLLSLALLPLLAWLVAQRPVRWLSLVILAGSLAGIKVYGATVVVPALILTAVVEWVRQRRTDLGLAALGSAGLAAGVLASAGSTLGFPFFWAPGWFLKSMFEAGDRLNWPTWEIHRQLFTQTRNWPRLVWHWGSALVIFLIGNLGAKWLGAAWWLRRRSPDTLDIFFGFLLIGSLAAPLLFLQKGIVWNSIQFLHYAQLPLGYFFLRWVESLGRKGLLILGVVVALALPSTIASVQRNLSPSNYVRYSAAFVASVQGLAVAPANQFFIVDASLFDTSIIPALSGHTVYWNDGAISEILGLPAEPYRQQIKQWQSNLTESCPPSSVIISYPEAASAIKNLNFERVIKTNSCPPGSVIINYPTR